MFGKEIINPCPQCGEELLISARVDYCPNCGYEQGYPIMFKKNASNQSLGSLPKGTLHSV